MCRFYHTSNTINLVTATKYTAFGVMEYCVFVKDLVNCSATTHGVIFAKYVAQITKQQRRYAVGHGLSPSSVTVPPVACEFASRGVAAVSDVSASRTRGATPVPRSSIARMS